MKGAKRLSVVRSKKGVENCKPTKWVANDVRRTLLSQRGDHLKVLLEEESEGSATNDTRYLTQRDRERVHLKCESSLLRRWAVRLGLEGDSNRLWLKVPILQNCQETCINLGG
jgi:hypothetical protein